MKVITFNQLKHMDHEELKDVKFKLKQDLDPKYCSEPNRIKELKKLMSYVKYLLYNPQSQPVT